MSFKTTTRGRKWLNCDTNVTTGQVLEEILCYKYFYRGHRCMARDPTHVLKQQLEVRQHALQ